MTFLTILKNLNCKIVLTILGFIFNLSISFGQSTAKQPKEETVSTVQSMLDFARKHLHIPYRSGGASKKGFDCSGFVRFCYQNFDISLPHSSAQQSKHGEIVAIESAKPGDLVFFKGERVSSTTVGHVGIITEVTPDYIKFIHSAFKGGIRYDLLNTDYYKNRLVAIRRLME